MITTSSVTRGESRDTTSHLARFEEFERSVAGNSPAWLRAIRTAGIAHFAEQGFPTTRHEEWRFTNVAPIAAFPFKPATRPQYDGVTDQAIEAHTFGGMACHRLVFVNGHFSPQLSTLLPRPDGVKLGCLAAAIHSDGPLVEKHLGRYAGYMENPFVAFNTAFIQDGAFIHIPARVELAEPVHLLFLTTEAGLTTFPRNLIIADRSSSVKVVEDHVSLVPLAHFTCPVTEIVTAENAAVEHLKLQRENESAFHVGAVQAAQAADSRVISHSISLGARLARNNIHLVLNGPGIDSILNGLYLAGGEQLMDHHTVADHASPRCNSHEFYHGILCGKARGVFNGKIFVRQIAQKTDAKQTNRNLLLSDLASVDTKPQLEIFADDVKCTHGATVGQLDEQAIFYLRSRGIGLNDARNMLVKAFAGGILDRITIGPVRAELERTLFERLEREQQAGS